MLKCYRIKRINLPLMSTDPVVARSAQPLRSAHGEPYRDVNGLNSLNQSSTSPYTHEVPWSNDLSYSAQLNNWTDRTPSHPQDVFTSSTESHSLYQQPME